MCAYVYIYIYIYVSACKAKTLLAKRGRLAVRGTLATTQTRRRHEARHAPPALIPTCALPSPSHLSANPGSGTRFFRNGRGRRHPGQGLIAGLGLVSHRGGLLRELPRAPEDLGSPLKIEADRSQFPSEVPRSARGQPQGARPCGS